MNYNIHIFGCQMNKSDGERIAGLLEKAGWQKCFSEENADLIIVIACSVRQTAVDRVYGRALKYAKLKKQKPNLKTVLTGCVLDSDKKKLAEKFDLICDIKDIEKISNFKSIRQAQSLPRLPAVLEGDCRGDKLQFSNSSPTVCAQKNNNYLKVAPKYTSSFQAYVPIMTGCDNFCSYCVVPYTRGREYSRPAEDILNEINQLVKNGYKEIFLLGQNVNSYSAKNLHLAPSSKEGELNFPDLLRCINNISGDFWIRFATSHPKDMSDELIGAIAECEKITPYLHLPIQSGSDKILKKMNRKYTKKPYLNLIKKIKSSIPYIMLSTDIIVGFPGETKKDFLETVDVARKVKYTMAYIARYSPRAGTAAYGLQDNVSHEEKAQREKVLTDILKRTALKNNKKFIGKTVSVLVERRTENSYIGKTAQFVNVKIRTKRHAILAHKTTSAQTTQQIKIGRFINVKILKATPFGMEGE